MIMHPISVGVLLESFGYDDNVVAAGYLHDVVEDTKYTRVVRKLKMWYNLSARYERRKLESSLYGVTLIHI